MLWDCCRSIAAPPVAPRVVGHVGFRPIGVARQHERSPDGTWHNNLLTDMLADEIAP